MTHPAAGHRFYGELVTWWPLISPSEDYAKEAAYAATLLGSASVPVREIPELGSGGGHNAVHLARSFAMTLVDLSEGMLAVSRRLNPECDHHRGDMRAVRLGPGAGSLLRSPPRDYADRRSDQQRARTLSDDVGWVGGGS